MLFVPPPASRGKWADADPFARRPPETVEVEAGASAAYPRCMELILASASPRRSALIAGWGIPFRVIPAEGIDEEAVVGEAVHVARTLAGMKAEAVDRALRGTGRGPEHVVVGADTVVEIAGEILNKPRDPADARRMLARLSGRVHRVHTGVAVVRPGGTARSGAETSEVAFRVLSERDIEEYVASGDAEGKAGAYGIQSGGRRLVDGFRGCYYNIVGLPLKRLAALLAEAGLRVPMACDCSRHPLWTGGDGCAVNFPGP